MNFGNDKKNHSNNPYVIFSIVLLCGFSLRIFLSMFLTYQPDFQTWIAWGSQIANVGFADFYDKYWCDYMPGYLYILRLLEYLHRIIPSFPVVILFKLPANLSDIGITILIFLALRDITNIRNALLCSIAYLFNPASLANSTFWGQVDSLNAFTILFSIFLGLRSRFALSGAFAALAFMIKPQSIIVFPLIGLITLYQGLVNKNRYDFKMILKPLSFIVGLIFILMIITVPYIWDQIDSFSSIFTGTITFINERFHGAYGQYEIASLNAFNLWGLFAMWENDQTLLFGLTYRSWGVVLFSLIYLLLMVLLLRLIWRRNNLSQQFFGYIVFETTTLILFALFMFVTRAHERHLLPAIVFFALILYRSRIFWIFYSIVSCVYVVNMTYAYIQLTTFYQGISDYASELLSVGMFFLYLVSFAVVLTDFIRNTMQYNDSKRLA